MTVAPQPGLDLPGLAALRTPRHSERDLIDRIGEHLDENDGYTAFSGGKDSTVVLDLARRADPDVPVCFFDSGLEFPETLSYVAEIADRWKLNLDVLPVQPTALQFLEATGVWDHQAQTRTELLQGELFHDLLIRRPAAAAHASHGPGELWGLRTQESAGRRALLLGGLAREIGQSCDGGCCPAVVVGRHTRQHRQRHGGITRRVDGTVAFSPVWDWRDLDIHAHLHRRQIPPNPLYRRLADLGAPPESQRVSLLVDGNGIGVGRYVWLRRGWPDLFEQLARVLPRLRELA